MIRSLLKRVYRNPTWAAGIARNYISQLRQPDVKIFFVGFNKCGTTSIHRLMHNSGIRSAHWQHGTENFAFQIRARAEFPEQLGAYLAPWTAYSDLSYSTQIDAVDGNLYFKELSNVFPNSYFILNDRNEDDWVRSRLSHRKGTYLARAVTRLGLSENEVEDLWRRQFRDHRAAVIDYFKDCPKFLHFVIDTDDVRTLANFLGPTFSIDARQWGVANRTKRHARHNGSR